MLVFLFVIFCICWYSSFLSPVSAGIPLVISCIGWYSSLLSPVKGGFTLCYLLATVQAVIPLLDHRDKDVREEGKKLIIESYRWIGRSSSW